MSKILLYAPSDDEGLAHIATIVQEVGLQDSWILMPMLKEDLAASDLSNILRDALHRVRKLLANSRSGDTDKNSAPGGVMFLGMDAPELPMDEIMTALRMAQLSSSALLCPSADGGYGMLCVPSTADSDLIFQDVLWSHALTAVSQIKALTDCNIVVKLGRLMHDVDEPDDVRQLSQRLLIRRADTSLGGVLEKPSNKEMSRHDGRCDFTIDALKELGLLK